MSAWNHAICEACWISREAVVSDGHIVTVRLPAVLRRPTLESCCFCGGPTIMGCFTRQDPETLPLCTGHDGASA